MGHDRLRKATGAVSLSTIPVLVAPPLATEEGSFFSAGVIARCRQFFRSLMIP